ncbi:MAG: class I SAM-dependent methyltransferase [Telmatospirillum sp.]|nr:class I SAM-dependent methyltransferase [Telmatospirillum sp.]
MPRLAGRSFLPFLILLAFAAILPESTALAEEGTDAKLRAIIAGDDRDLADRARDIYRHPLETLTFFGLRDDLTVVEISPSPGWWTEILAPYLRDHGKYYAAVPAGDAPTAEQIEHRRRFSEKLAGRSDLYAKVALTPFGAPDAEIAPPGSADLVLTFRNIHNWMANGSAEQAFRSFYRALKPGGILGVEEHRGRADQPQDPKAKSGYVREDVIVALAEQAGFRLVAKSDINANPRDTKDYPGGVWTLPPTLSQQDRDRDRYLAIGESDRATLKFQKPEQP